MSENKHPHILILMTDQQRADCLSCAGHPQIRTPNMDRIAAEGARFEQAVTVCPVCMPARASFINGLYPHNHGMWTNAGRMPAGDETFFQHLQKAGYLTAHIGKSHYYNHALNDHLKEEEPYMHARGLEYVHETTGPWATTQSRSYMTDWWEKKGIYQAFIDDYRGIRKQDRFCADPSPHSEDDFQDSYIGRTAVEFVEGYSDERPMCLFAGFGGPHEPFDAPGKYASMYNPSETPAPIPVPEGLDDLPEYLRESAYFNPHPQFAPEKVPAVQANYFGKISLLDHWFGQLTEACERKGWLDDLVIIHWSDHGEMLGDHGKLFKNVFLESSIRVPLTVRWPGRIPAGTVSPALAEIIDVFPTLLEGLGIAYEGRCQGRSLLPVIDDPSRTLRECQLSEIHLGIGRTLMVRTERYKYAVDQQSRSIMLFDLQNDPQEQHNLIGKDDELEQTMRDMLLKRLVAAQFTMGD